MKAHRAHSGTVCEICIANATASIYVHCTSGKSAPRRTSLYHFRSSAAPHRFQVFGFSMIITHQSGAVTFWQVCTQLTHFLYHHHRTRRPRCCLYTSMTFHSDGPGLTIRISREKQPADVSAYYAPASVAHFLPVHEHTQPTGSGSPLFSAGFLFTVLGVSPSRIVDTAYSSFGL
jgi:hypothetical protein